MAKSFKEMMAKYKEFEHIMTDMTGQYHRVIMVTKYKDLAEYQKISDQYKNPTPEMKKEMENMPNYHEMYVSGSREIFQVW